MTGDECIDSMQKGLNMQNPAELRQQFQFSAARDMSCVN